MPFPIAGINRGEPMARQPPLSCDDALNVRTFDQRLRRGGGKRPGMLRAFTTQLTGSAGTASRVTGLAVLRKAATTYIPPTAVTTTTTVSATGLTLAATDLGNGWLQYLQIGNASPSTTKPAIRSSSMIVVSATPLITFTGPGNVTSGFISQYATTNKATVVASVNSLANGTGTGTDGPDDSGMQIGPFIRSNTDTAGNSFTNYIWAGYVRVGANTAAFKVIRRSNGVDTILSTQATRTLNASATLTALTIILQEIDSSTIRATATWTSGGSAGATLTEDVTVATALGNTNNRAGVIKHNGSTARTVQISSMTVDAMVYDLPQSRLTMAASTVNPFGSNQFYVPSGITAFGHDNPLGSSTTLAGAQTPLTTTQYPVVDDTNNILARGTGNANDPNFFTQTTAPTERLGMAVKVPAQVTLAGANFTVVTRVASTFLSYIQWVFTVTRVAGTGCWGISKITAAACSGGTLAAPTTILNDSGANAQTEIGGRLTTDFAIVWDTGEDPLTTTAYMRIVVKGITVFEYSLPSGTYGSVAAPNLYSGGVSNLRVGAGLINSDTNANELSELRWMDVGVSASGGSATATTTTGVGQYIVGFTNDRIYAGDTFAGAMTRVLGVGLTSGVIVATAMIDPGSGTNKLFTVDGQAAVVVDAVNSVSSTWTATTAGTLPSACALSALFLGRMVLARQPSDKSAYFMSRTGDPYDWSYGATPLSTQPIAGRNSPAGVPGDAITALIVGWDDYLIFGCEQSIWVLAGDPAFGGRVNCVSQKTGVLGPRAFCYDNRGNLYVMGTGGLFRIVRGGFNPEDVAEGRLETVLRNVNLTTTQCLMAFDPVDEVVHIYLTPYTLGTHTHVIYDTRNDALWFERYPNTVGPFAVCEPAADTYEYRRPLLGGDDGYIRKLDRGQLNDNDSSGAIGFSSFVRYAPVLPPAGISEVMAMELQAEGGVDDPDDSVDTSNSTLTWRLYSSHSADAVRVLNSGAESVTGSWFASLQGFQTPVRLRTGGGAIQLELAQDTTLSTRWAMEQAVLFVIYQTRRRRP